MWRMNVSASIQNSSRSPVRRSAPEAQNTSRENRTWSVSVGVNAVKSWVPTTRVSARRQRAQIERSRPVQRSPALRGRSGPAGSAPGRCTPGRSHPAARRTHPASRNARQRPPHPRAAARSDPRTDTGGPDVRRDLARRVNARVGPTRDRQRHGLDRAKQDAERALHLSSMHRPPGCCAQPENPLPSYSSSEPRDLARQTSSSSTISVASERRGPSFRIRV